MKDKYLDKAVGLPALWAKIKSLLTTKAGVDLENAKIKESWLDITLPDSGPWRDVCYHIF